MALDQHFHRIRIHRCTDLNPKIICFEENTLDADPPDITFHAHLARKGDRLHIKSSRLKPAHLTSSLINNKNHRTVH